jgi:enamine deaminase RidA (YjgF/YER057c/UK114 family)
VPCYAADAYLAAQVPEHCTHYIRGQTQPVLASMDKLLVEAGTNKSRVLMAQVFLADLAEEVDNHRSLAAFRRGR